MKVKQKSTKNADPKILDIRNLKVKLHRLTKAEIEKIINDQSSTINYNFTLKIDSNNPWECLSTNYHNDQQPSIKISDQNVIQIRLRSENEKSQMNETTVRSQVKQLMCYVRIFNPSRCSKSSLKSLLIQ